jgi:hypothetical protein
MEKSLMPENKRPHGSRFRDALVIINPGACNPSGVTLRENRDGRAPRIGPV